MQQATEVWTMAYVQTQGRQTRQNTDTVEKHTIFLPWMLIKNMQEAALPSESVAVILTVWIPGKNGDPDTGLLVTVTFPPLLSLAAGSTQVRFTAAPRGPENVCWLGGHPLVNLGGSTSETLMKAQGVLVLLLSLQLTLNKLTSPLQTWFQGNCCVLWIYC